MPDTKIDDMCVNHSKYARAIGALAYQMELDHPNVIDHNTLAFLARHPEMARHKLRGLPLSQYRVPEYPEGIAYRRGDPRSQDQFWLGYNLAHRLHLGAVCL